MSFQTCPETLRAQREATVAIEMDFHALVEIKNNKYDTEISGSILGTVFNSSFIQLFILCQTVLKIPFDLRDVHTVTPLIKNKSWLLVVVFSTPVGII